MRYKSKHEESFQKSVEKLHQRLDRAEHFIDTQLIPTKVDEEVSKGHSKSASGGFNDHAEVHVTIHRKHASTSTKRNEDSFSKPVLKRVKSRSLEKERIRHPSNAGQTYLRNLSSTENNEELQSDKINNLLTELRLAVNSKSNIVGSVQQQEFRCINKLQKPVISKIKASSKIAVQNCETPDHLKHELEVTKLKQESRRLRSEVDTYKCEYDTVVKQVEISKGTVKNLESQVLDLKKIVSNLTRNNGELLSLVSEKIKYEDTIAELEKNKSTLSQELSDEIDRSKKLHETLTSVVREVEQYRTAASDIEAGLKQGISALQVDKAGNMNLPNFGPETLSILELKDNKNDHTDAEDSAYDDPNSESLNSRSKSVAFQKSAEKSVPLQQFTPPTRIRKESNLLQEIPGSRCSTLVDEQDGENFQPLSFDLTNTISQVAVEQFSSIKPPKAHSNGELSKSKNLDNKVSCFLSKLNEASDPFQFGVHAPQPRPFPEPSMHLSLSSSDIEGDNSANSTNTTITERKFLQGLESSIDFNNDGISSFSDSCI